MIKIIEVDCLEQSKIGMQKYENKYNMSSKNLYEGSIGSTFISPRDFRCWKFDIECYLQCGGTL